VEVRNLARLSSCRATQLVLCLSASQACTRALLLLQLSLYLLQALLLKLQLLLQSLLVASCSSA